MKATVDGVTFEGTPAEIAEYRQIMQEWARKKNADHAKQVALAMTKQIKPTSNYQPMWEQFQTTAGTASTKPYIDAFREQVRELLDKRHSE